MTRPEQIDQVRAALDRLVRAVYVLWGDPENCEDCAARDEAHHVLACGSVCAVHGDSRCYEAMLAAEESLGPCLTCGHRRSEHHDEDTTACRRCQCRAFELPLCEPPEAALSREAPTPEPVDRAALRAAVDALPGFVATESSAEAEFRLSSGGRLIRRADVLRLLTGGTERSGS